MKAQCMAFGLVAVVAAASAAQDESVLRSARGEDVVLDEMVVLASRTRREAYELPANVTVISSDRITGYGSLSLIDVLRDQAGVVVQSYSGNRSEGQVAMRGFGENAHGRVLVLLNGRRLNRPDMASINWQEIPLANVERVEVLRGSQTVLYGDMAVGGVINIITRQRADKPAELSASVMGGSYGMNDERFGVFGSVSNLTYAAGAERSEATGFRRNSGYLFRGGYASLGYALNERLSADLNIAYNRLRSDLPGSLTKKEMEKDPRQSTAPDDGAENEFATVAIGVRAALGDAGLLDVGIHYGRKKQDTTMPSWDISFDSVINTWGATPRLELELEPAGFRNTLLLGADAYLDALDVDNHLDAQSKAVTSEADITRRTLGVYAKDEFFFNESLSLALGGRIDQARYGATVESGGTTDLDDSATHNAQAADIALTWRLPERSKVFARAGTVYRFPFVDEQFSYVGYGDQMYADLSPERGRNYEAGAEVRLPGAVSLGLTVFLLDMSDEINWNRAEMRNENMDSTRHAGTEAQISWNQSRWFSLWVNHTYTRARFTDGENDGNSVPLVPEHKVSAGADFTIVPADLSLGASVTWVGRQYLGGDYANEQEMLDAYATVDAGARYRPLKWLEAFAGVDNAFDDEYAPIGYYNTWAGRTYYPAAGRAYKAGMTVKF